MDQPGVRRSSHGHPSTDRPSAVVAVGWQRATPNYSIIAIIISVILVMSLIVVPLLTGS